MLLRVRKCAVAAGWTVTLDLCPGLTSAILQAVDELLAVMAAQRDEPVPIPSWHHGAGNAATDGTMPLRDALIQCYDIRCHSIQESFSLSVTSAKTQSTLNTLHISPA